MFQRIQALAFASSIAFACFCSNLFAQTTGTILGQVIDSTNAAIGSASIEVENLGTHLIRKGLTSGEGAYLFPSLTPGTYKVTVSAQGFRSFSQSGITLEVGQKVSVGTILQEGSVNQSLAKHPANPPAPVGKRLDELTSEVTAKLPKQGAPSNQKFRRNNYIDDFIFGKMERDNVPHAELASDEEFLRRTYLDLTGRIPQPDHVRKFLADADPRKRDRLIDDLTDAKVDPAAIEHPTSPFLDRWTYFFCDLFKNAAAEIGVKGRNLFWDYINTALLLDTPYNQFVTEMLTASARSNWQDGPSGFLARTHADDADGLAINHEDTIEDIAIATSRNFLGVNLECIACHDGAAHLEKINLWLSRAKRDEFWRQASFFGGIRIYRAFGIGQEFAVLDKEQRFDLQYPSVKRVQRYPKDTTPTFLLTGETAAPGEGPRRAYARMLTSHPQFARVAVNLIWSELMGVGIVDPPLDFDLDRQDPNHPPPAPWTVQPSHPELLDALAKDFVAHNYSLRYVMKTIAKSSAYQLSSRFDGKWDPNYARYGARHFARRVSAEQLYDAIAQASGVFVDIPIAGTGDKVTYAMQTRDPADFSGKDLEHVNALLADFGQSNRDQGEKNLSSSMVQASALLNGALVKDRVRANQGRLKMLLTANPLMTNASIVEELFLAALGRFPTDHEARIGVTQIEKYRDTGAEDLLWSLLNKTEFLFNH
jgi:hypothetical protein